MIKREHPPSGKHHPYCVHTFMRLRKYYWECTCDIIKDYDKWRRDTKKEKLDEK